ncbi:MAG: hypothetical protein LBG84_08195 [Treponema sp.]|jgi:diacylglycerol kinase family enzyme|nr:hypothetical protein [Treponema sp.]
MKHLFIINPKARRIQGRVDELEGEIQNHFSGRSHVEFAIHKTQWKRDASGYVLSQVSGAREITRVYVLGGDGLLFEVINGVVGLPNAQIAWYPLGGDNSLISAFGGKNSLRFFRSIKRLSLSPVVTIDTIRAGHHYAVIHALIGGEAEALRQGEVLADKFRMLPRSACYMAMGLGQNLLKNSAQSFRLEGEDLEYEGELISILITNAPAYAEGLRPAPGASINDGYLDLFMIKPIPRIKLAAVIADYERGRYHKWPAYISRYRRKKVRISSRSTMTIILDGEFFYNTSIEFEVFPRSLDFVCPWGVSPGPEESR